MAKKIKGDKPEKSLVIVESPAKAKTLEKFLGKGFFVKACAGHVRDLPSRRLGVDVDNDFAPKYTIIQTKKEIVKELSAAARESAHIYLAPDPDREGEAIAWHLFEILPNQKNIQRIEFNEITQEAVLEAVQHPREINTLRVEAQQARRILDRLVGYKLSPLLWKKVRKGLSAGRVQSVAVRVICDREALIRAFQPKEYWTIDAELSKQQDSVKFRVRLFQQGEKEIEVGNQTDADQVTAELKSHEYIVKSVESKEVRRHPAPPFITSTLQQESFNKLGFSSKKTMVIAQQLYEGVPLKGEGPVGLITYMRTDSVRIADVATQAVREFIGKAFGKAYLPKSPRIYKVKKQAQDAHEAIRPTSAIRTPETLADSLNTDQKKLYDLIWNRFVASQMESAVFDQKRIEVSAGDYRLKVTGRTLKFDGFLRLYREADDEQDKESEDHSLPPLDNGEKLTLHGVLPEQHFTEPPPRFTEASLVKELEQNGIGRPSTYAPIISTIVSRGYVIKEGRAFMPTETGETINDLLTKHFPIVMDLKFTAKMEEELDEILEGKVHWVKMLREFYEPFAKTLEEAHEKMEKVKKEIMTEVECEKCGKKMMIRSGPYGDFLACTGFPECRGTKEVPLELGGKPKEVTDEKCEKCGKPMTIKRGRFGQFLACTGYPDCKTTKPILRKIGVKCPKCSAEIVQKKTRKGKVFYSCERYPDCDYSSWTRPEG